MCCSGARTRRPPCCRPRHTIRKAAITASAAAKQAAGMTSRRGLFGKGATGDRSVQGFVRHSARTCHPEPSPVATGTVPGGNRNRPGVHTHAGRS